MVGLRKMALRLAYAGLRSSPPDRDWAYLGLVLVAARLRMTGLGFMVLGIALLWIAAMPVTARLVLGSLER